MISAISERPQYLTWRLTDMFAACCTPTPLKNHRLSTRLHRHFFCGHFFGVAFIAILLYRVYRTISLLPIDLLVYVKYNTPYVSHVRQSWSLVMLFHLAQMLRLQKYFVCRCRCECVLFGKKLDKSEKTMVENKWKKSNPKTGTENIRCLIYISMNHILFSFPSKLRTHTLASFMEL